ncbi:hypothetical protein JL722_13138 [Aureococcus anophagefferens]|nr:hypothetical protein JL722_13138 [Aureococcus anophagefferens]
MGLWPKPKHKAPAAPSGARSAAPLGASFGDEAPRVGKKAEPPAPREPYVPLELAARRLDQLQGDAANFRETRLLELEDLGAAWARRRRPSAQRTHYAACVADDPLRGPDAVRRPGAARGERVALLRACAAAEAAREAAARAALGAVSAALRARRLGRAARAGPRGRGGALRLACAGALACGASPRRRPPARPRAPRPRRTAARGRAAPAATTPTLRAAAFAAERKALLQADVSLVATAATDDSLKAASRDDLERAARASALQAEHTHEELAKAQQMITALKARTKDLESRPVGDASGDAAATDELEAARDEAKTLARAVGRSMKESVVKGTALWKGGKRAECCAAYKAAARDALAKLPAGVEAAWVVNGDDLLAKARPLLEAALRDSESQTAARSRAGKECEIPNFKGSYLGRFPLARGAVALRKAFDKVMEHLAVVIRADAASAAPPAAAAAAVAAPGGGGDVARLAASSAPRRAATRRGAQARGGDQDLRAEQAKALKQLEKKHKKELDELKKAADKDQRKAAGELKRVGKELEKAAGELDATRKERDALRAKVADLEALTSNLDELRTKAARVDDLETSHAELLATTADAEAKYKTELALRKKYWNMMEDMKGKIRVFVRCRPFAKYELEKKCGSVVHFDDDTTLTVDGHNGPKVFNFDNVFPPVVGGDAGQGDVFEDTSNLIQSCLDGFNVCIFAYGQTGSGKTFTMTGVATTGAPGITPRSRAFDEAQKMAHQCTVTVRTYFLELYNDGLVDLYHVLDNPGSRAAPPKLDVKLDAKKMVFVKNAVVKDAASADELLNLFEAGNAKRHVGATKMNAESSRSHSIFAILVEVYNRTTKKTSVGKLSLVDLAGSERADKTGATDERLKEAQNINKSLSALGDVISALSTGEKFIPYRNNKLTLVMQDSLGGNAKTLMFVNISPADYNADETVTSLTYASRVKLIKNTANKNAESEEVAQLKAIIKNLKAGGTGEVAGADVLL